MVRQIAFNILAAVSMLVLAGCGGGPTPATGDPSKPGDKKDPPAAKDPNRKRVIAVIPKSTSHEFWKQVEAGAMSAVKDKNYEIIFKAGEPGNDANAQLTLVDRLLGQVDAMVLAPVHSKFLVQAVNNAFDRKIPLVIIDSGVDADFNKYASFVATDNKDGGSQCARTLANALGGKGDVLLFRYEPGSASTMEREEGFTETLAKEFPGIKIIAEKHAGPTRESALKNANELIAANPKFDGVFACNESSAMGMLLALREKGLAGKVKYVGFDTAKELIDAVEKGEIEALAAQDPFKIGANGVEQAIFALEKKPNTHIIISAVMKGKKEFEMEERLRKQEEDDQKREADLKRMEEENKRHLEEQRKQIEAEQKANEAKK